MNASISTSPAASAASNASSTSAGRRRVRLLAQHVLARLERAHRPLVVQAVRQRDVDGVDLRVGEQRVVRAVRARQTRAPARTRPRDPGRGSRRRRSRPFCDAAAPARISVVDLRRREQPEPHHVRRFCSAAHPHVRRRCRWLVRACAGLGDCLVDSRRAPRRRARGLTRAAQPSTCRGSRAPDDRRGHAGLGEHPRDRQRRYRRRRASPRAGAGARRGRGCATGAAPGTAATACASLPDRGLAMRLRVEGCRVSMPEVDRRVARSRRCRCPRPTG